ncbi:MAG: hypothetical protein AABX07_02440 [Nanoarchaeota archaeon]
MSLVDKLEGVHMGDLLFLEGKEYNYDRVGYVIDYTPKTITLSNTSPIDKETKEVRDMGFWNRIKRERIVKLPLKCFFAYRVLERFAIPEGKSKE